jgi:hypothetical protein
MVLTKTELLLTADTLTRRAYLLLETYPGNELFQERATELFQLANKFTSEACNQ